MIENKRFRVEKQIFDGYCIIDNHFDGYYAYEKQDLEKLCENLNDLNDENEKLKQDNTGLMKLLENQSIIIQELHSKILEFELKEPITLTKEDLELMGKAISYYTHGRCGE